MKKILIVGSNGSLGKRLVELFSGNNYVCISPSSLELNLCNKSSIESFCDNINSIDGVVFVAGKEPSQNIDELNWSHFEEMIDIHYKGVLWCIKHLKNKIKKNGFIIMTSSVASFKGSYDPTYSSLKSAINGLTKTLSIELSPKIRVNCVAPSLIENTQVFNTMTDDFINKHITTTPLKKLATIDDVCDVYIFLSQNNHITGQIININGGQYV
jgi:NAD(P)-dependent dehydrogenase (short-subunit alcohol dehydrogenase family)